jgi:hypothetical protein
MGSISFKLPDELFEMSGRYAEALSLSRAEYIGRAIDRMNRETRAAFRANRLADISRKVRKESNCTFTSRRALPTGRRRGQA